MSIYTMIDQFATACFMLMAQRLYRMWSAVGQILNLWVREGGLWVTSMAIHLETQFRTSSSPLEVNKHSLLQMDLSFLRAFHQALTIWCFILWMVLIAYSSRVLSLQQIQLLQWKC